MRLCANETTDVYETQGDNLAGLLREAAKQLDEVEHVWASVNVGPGYETSYLLTLYVH